MLAKTLQRLLEENHTTAREIGELAGVSTSTVYRWIAAQSQPDFDSIRLLVRHLPNKVAQEEIIAAFTAGTDWSFTHTELDLDMNQDGLIDADDALDATIEAAKASCDALSQFRAANRKGLDADDTLELMALLASVTRHSTITQRVLVDMAEARRKRKLKLAK